jgi:hypothetical protein
MNNDPIDALTQAIDGLLRDRDGEIYGRIGWIATMLSEQRPYVVASLPSSRDGSIRYLTKNADALRQRGYGIRFREFVNVPGAYVRIWKVEP